MKISESPETKKSIYILHLQGCCSSGEFALILGKKLYQLHKIIKNPYHQSRMLNSLLLVVVAVELLGME
jgi:hypothetical protein